MIRYSGSFITGGSSLSEEAQASRAKQNGQPVKVQILRHFQSVIIISEPWLSSNQAGCRTRPSSLGRSWRPLSLSRSQTLERRMFQEVSLWSLTIIRPWRPIWPIPKWKCRLWNWKYESGHEYHTSGCCKWHSYMQQAEPKSGLAGKSKIVLFFHDDK